ncbi:MAG: YdcH family protein [Alteraurantiacibacter sp.]
MKARFYILTELHAKLDTAIRREITMRAPNQFKVMALRRRKMRVKDLLSRLARGVSSLPRSAQRSGLTAKGADITTWPASWHPLPPHQEHRP